MPYDLKLSVSPSGGIGNELTVGATIGDRNPMLCAPDPVELLITVTGTMTSATIGADGINLLHRKLEVIVDWWHGQTDGSTTFSTTLRFPSGLTTNRYSYGLRPTNVLPAGTYTPRIIAREPVSGFEGEYIMPAFPVLTPEQAIPAADRIWVSPSGTFPPEAAGQTQVTTGDIFSVLSGNVFGQANPKLVNINRNEAYTWPGGPSDGIGAWNGNPFPTTMIRATGTGAAPAVTVSSYMQYDDTGGSTSGKALIIEGLAFTGSYDDSTTAGNTGDLPFWLLGTALADEIILANLTFRNVEAAVLTSDTVPTSTRLTLYDVDIENVSYGGLLDAVKFVRIGVRCHSSANSIMNSTSNQGWAFRFDCSFSYTFAYDAFRNQGWSGFGSQIASQECDRISTGGDHLGSDQLYFASIMEAPRGALAVGYSETGGNDTSKNVVFKSCVFMAGYQADHIVKTGIGGTYFLSCLFLQPDVQGRLNAGDDFQSAVDLTSNAALLAANRDAPIGIEYCTFANRQLSSRNAFGKQTAAVMLRNIDGFTSVANNNNVLHQPGIASPGPSIPDAPLSDDTNVYQIMDKGYLSSTEDLRASTAPITTAGMSDDYEPEAGSAALANATGEMIPYFDLRLGARTQPLNRGAI